MARKLLSIYFLFFCFNVYAQDLNNYEKKEFKGKFADNSADNKGSYKKKTNETEGEILENHLPFYRKNFFLSQT